MSVTTPGGQARTTYIPQPSYWPIVGSVALLLMGMGAAFWMNGVARRAVAWSRRASRCSCS